MVESRTRDAAYYDGLTDAVEYNDIMTLPAATRTAVRARKQAIREGRLRIVYEPSPAAREKAEAEAAAVKAANEASTAAKIARRTPRVSETPPDGGVVEPVSADADVDVDTLLGLPNAPECVRVGDSDVPFMNFVAFAQRKTGMSVASWNQLPEKTRATLVYQEIQNAQAVAAPPTDAESAGDEAARAAELLDEAGG